MRRESRPILRWLVATSRRRRAGVGPALTILRTMPAPRIPPIEELPPLERHRRPRWQRVLWASAGAAALGAGIIGAFLPLLPTTPLVLLAAFCFSRSSARLERWLLEHRHFGPMIEDWRARRAIPRRAKRLAWAMMAIGSAWAAWVLPAAFGWIPAAVCAAVAWWMWRLPDREDVAATITPDSGGSSGDRNASIRGE